MQTEVMDNGRTTRPVQNKVLHYRFRWPVVATGDKSIEVRIPTGNGYPVVDESFAESQEMTLAEIRHAEELVLASIAIVEQPGKVG